MTLDELTEENTRAALAAGPVVYALLVALRRAGLGVGEPDLAELIAEGQALGAAAAAPRPPPGKERP